MLFTVTVPRFALADLPSCLVLFLRLVDLPVDSLVTGGSLEFDFFT